MPHPLAALAALVGEENVRDDEASRARASAGWSPRETKEKQAGGGIPARIVDAVVLPGTTAEVAAVVRWANQTRTPLVPVGGSSNTVGSTRPERNAVAVDLSRLDSLRWDEDALVVHAGAGWNVGALEEKLSAHGYTLGHFPQSLNLATVGGCVATNAIGVLSGRYGRQSDLTLGIEAVLPTGEVIRTPVTPTGSSFGPDLASLFLGSEGTLGIVTEAALRMWPVPDVRAWAAFTFPDFAAALTALRLIYRTDARPAALRLFDAPAAEASLRRAQIAPGPALLLLTFEGDELVQTGAYQMAHAVCQKSGGTERDGAIGERWFEERLDISWIAPNGRPGGLADALAVSALWPALPNVYETMRAALSPLVTQLHAQVGHADPHGAALEWIWGAQAEPPTPAEAVALYERVVTAGANACLDAGGALAHHYGVGATYRAFRDDERAAGDRALLRRLKAALDPAGILNVW